MTRKPTQTPERRINFPRPGPAMPTAYRFTDWAMI